jgi:ribonuclease J
MLPELFEENERAVKKVAAMRSFEAKNRIMVGDITVTPYFVSHSACDAYMFLIEAGDKRILHTGDFRGHGYLSKGTIPTIKKHILRDGAVDFLITEGTMLSRREEKVETERELAERIEDVMRRYKYVFAMCSSTDMERLASFAAANRKMQGRMLVGDEFQCDVMRVFTDTKGEYLPLFQFDEVIPFDFALGREMNKRGFCIFVRASVGNKFVAYWNFLKQFIDPAQTVLIYSMWKEYVNPDSRHINRRYLDYVSMFPNVEKLHTSGHASPEFLAEVCRAVNPALGIIPIHSEISAAYVNLPIGKELQRKIIISDQCKK